MEFYAIMTDEITTKNKIIEKKIHKCTSKFPNYILDFLSNFDIRIILCDIKDAYGVLGKGSYIACSRYGLDTYLISIDNNSITGIDFVLCHEIGHFIDDIIGCIINEKEINLENTRKYKISYTQKDYQEAVANEHDFFVQCKRSGNEEFDKHDYAEIFADSFAELILERKTCSLLNTKRCILKHTKTIMENYKKKDKVAIS